MLRKLLVLCPLLLAGLIAVGSGQTLVRKFNFGSKKPSPIYKRVLDDTIYNAATGYGFEPGAAVTCVERPRIGEESFHLCTSNSPFYFSVALPEGNYRVSVGFGDDQAATSTVVKAELRRLMVERVDTQKGIFDIRRFIVNIRTPQISTGGEVKLKDRERTSESWAWDNKLTLEFNGSRPTINAIEVQRVDVPTIFLLGDSTVCDQPSEPYASWGQMITRFFGGKVAVANHAESGESLKSSRAAKRLDKVLSLMRPDDYLLIQYGHNDEKEKGEGVGAFTTFKNDLKDFVEEARKKGGIPILITPVQRRTFAADGHVTNSHGDYPEAVRQIAKEENVPLIDLTARSKELYEALGQENSGRLFKDGDGTHHNNYGAYQLAKIIVQSIRDQHLPIAKYLVKNLPKYDPKRPDDFATFAIPPSPAVTNVKPLGN